MADPLATTVNRIDPNSGAAIPPPVTINQPLRRTLLGSTLLGSAADYVENSDLYKAISSGDIGDILEMGYRANPMLQGQMFRSDLVTKGTDEAVQNVGALAASYAKIPGNILSGTIGAYSDINKLYNLFSGSTSVWPGAETLDWAAQPVRDLNKQLGEAIAGRPLSDSIFYGTPAERVGAASAQTLQMVLPTPDKLNKLLSGIKLANETADTVMRIAARALEVVTPLAVNPSPKTTAVNAIAGNVIGAVAEPLVAGQMINSEVNRQLAQTQTPEQQAVTNVLDQAHDVAKEGTPKAIQAGLTGNPTADLVGGMIIAAGGAYLARNTALMQRVRDGVNRSIFGRIGTGYDPSLVQDATRMPAKTLIEQQFGNANASLFKSHEQVMAQSRTGVTPAQAEALSRQRQEEAASRSGPAAGTRAELWARQGTFMDTPVRSVSYDDFVTHARDVANDVQRDTANKVLHMMQERDLRQLAASKTLAGAHLNTPTAPIGSNVADVRTGQITISGMYPRDMFSHNLYDMTYQDLQRGIQMGMADPTTARIVNEYRNIMRGSQAYMDAEKRFTTSQIRDFQRQYPNYVPPGDQSQFLKAHNPIGNYDPRNRTFVPRGVRTFEELPNALETLPRYMEQVFRSVEGTKTARDWYNDIRPEYLAGNPMAQQFIGKEIGPGAPGTRPPPGIGHNSGTVGPSADYKYVTIRDSNGQKIKVEIHDAAVRDALSGTTNPAVLAMSSGLFGQWSKTMARWYEKGATGANAFFAGTMFSPTGALYNATVGSILPRPPGVHMGAIDALAQSLFPKALKGGIGIDPTFLFGQVPLGMAENVGAVVLDRMWAAANHALVTNKFFGMNADPATMQAISNFAERWYKRTAAYGMKQQGLSGAGMLSVSDPHKAGSTFLGRQGLYDKPTLLGSTALGSATAPLGATGKFITDILNAMGGGTGTAVWRSNIGRVGTPGGPALSDVSSTIRNLSGDPGRSGAFRNAEKLAEAANTVPWGNISLQSAGRAAGIKASEWPAVAAKIATTVMIPAAMVTLWNADQGEEYLKHDLFTRPIDNVLRSIYIGEKGKAPTEGREIALYDPLAQYFWAMGKAITATAMGLWSSDYWTGNNAHMKDAYSEMLKQRYFGLDSESALPTWVKQSILPAAPPAVNLGLAAGQWFGGPKVQMRSLVEAHTNPVDRRVGYMEGDDSKNVMAGVLPGWTADAASALGATFGRFLYTLGTQFIGDQLPINAQKGNNVYSPGDAARHAADTIGQSWADNAPGVGALFHTFRSITPSMTAQAVYTKMKMDPVNTLAAAVSTTENRKQGDKEFLGNSKTIGLERYAGAHPAWAPDDNTRLLGEDIATFKKGLAATDQELSLAYEQLASLRQSNKFTPYEKRDKMEEQSYRIINLNERVAQEVMRQEAALSQRYGVDVQFDKIQMGTSMFGFKPRMKLP